MKGKEVTLILVIGMVFALGLYSILNVPNGHGTQTEQTTKTITLSIGQSVPIRKGGYRAEDYLSYSGIINPVHTQGVLTLVDYEWVSTGGAGASIQYYVFKGSVVVIDGTTITVIDLSISQIELEVTGP